MVMVVSWLSWWFISYAFSNCKRVKICRRYWMLEWNCSDWMEGRRGYMMKRGCYRSEGWSRCNRREVGKFCWRRFINRGLWLRWMISRCNWDKGFWIICRRW